MKSFVVLLALLLVGCRHQPAPPTTTVLPVATPQPTSVGRFTPPCYSADGMPDPTCTPGAIDQRVTQANLASTVCKSGYTASVRPSATVSAQLKRTVLTAYGIPLSQTSKYELDHLVMLGIGGHPTALENLFPQLWDGQNGAHRKDAVENRAQDALCCPFRAQKAACSAPTVTLGELQRAMASDWRAVGRNLRVPGF